MPEKLERVVHDVFVGFVYWEIIYISCVQELTLEAQAFVPHISYRTFILLVTNQ